MTGLLIFLHQRFAYALVALAIVLGLWGTYQYLRHREVSSGFRASYLMLAGLAAVQGLAGVLIYFFSGPPHHILHVVYGIFAVAFLPGLYFYAGRGARDREAVFLASACWIVLVALVRGISTGR